MSLMTWLLSHRLLLLLLASRLLAACASSPPAPEAWESTEQEEATACDEAYADQCVVMACDEGECGVFNCEDMDPVALARIPQAHDVELAQFYRPPFRGPGTQRNWRRAGLREGARPRMTFHFQYRQGFLPAFPRLDGKLVKHHLFPREENLAKWFKIQGINIHEWTMLLPEPVHLRIHRGARGGSWNEAWRQFKRANEDRQVSPEELLRKAFELSLRFDIAGPISPYYSPVPPPGPQLLAP
jgi:uncharacterized lipoprotein (TIGR02269 family)